MDFVLVFPLILAFLSGGLCRTELPEQTSISCYKICPAGYHKTGDCDNGSHKCEKCENDTFTEKENLLKKCLRCTKCASANEVKIRQCSSNSDSVCDCKEGYYYYDYGDSGNSFKFCKQCTYQKCKDPNNKHNNNHEYKRKIQNCQREECLNHAECKKKCTLTSRPPANMTASITVSPKYITVKSTPTIPSNGNPLEAKGANDIPWLYLLMVVSILVILFGLLLFIKNLQRKPNFHPSWSMNKGMESHVEDPKIHEQRSHQMSSPTTLTYTIFEETPMMSVSHSPATPKHPAHISTLLPNAEQKVARQDEQSEHWPAIVLYAIIKEVPLRRWKEFLRLLSVADQQLERVELEAGYSLCSMERQYQMLRLWSQGSTASLNDVFSALHYMDLSGCAQLLQESLEKLQWSFSEASASVEV